MKQIIYKGVCLDSDDPKRLGRIRAYLISERSFSRERANENEGFRNYQDWDERDPFVYEPFMPYFLNTPPNKDSCVRLIYSHLEKKGSKDKYYVPCTPSSASKLEGEAYEDGLTNSDEGSRNKKYRDFLKNGEFFNKKTKGVFAEPTDVAIYGKGNSDIIIKKNEILLRSGRNKDFKHNQSPESEDNRAFLHLTRYDSTVKKNPDVEIYKRNKKDKTIRTLVEYNLDIPAVVSIDTLFSGDLFVYHLNDKRYDTSNLIPGREVDSVVKKTLVQIHYTNLSIDTLSKVINDLIKLVTFQEENNDITDIKNRSYGSSLRIDVLPSENKIKGNVFPLYYRPTNNLYNKINEEIVNIEVAIPRNLAIAELFSKVRPIEGKNENLWGNGLIYDSGKRTTVPTDLEKQTRSSKETSLEKKSVGVFGSDELYLLSHKSIKSGLQKGIDLSDTIYGLNENKITDELQPKTSSLVRGEELIELLDLIVKFLFNHIHNIPHVAPDAESKDGTKKSDITTELEKAYEKILNRNIRIN
jgi:hypothetical protein